MKKVVAVYEQSSTQASILQILNTVIPFFLVWYLAYASLSLSIWLTLALSIMNAGLTIRMFILFHDCCHHSFFKARWANEIIGTLLGIFTLSPYRKFKREHDIHHATSGNLDKRGTGDVPVWTVDEYVEAPLWKRILYRLYRNPFVMFGLGPVYVFLILFRLNRKQAKRGERWNTYLINLSIGAILGGLVWLIGWQAVLLIQGTIFIVSGAAGIWLFYVQHQFEPSYFEEHEEWDYVRAALEGSSYYHLPGWLQWFTGNIGFHHIHHLSPKVPNYHLEHLHQNISAFKSVSKLTILSSLRSLRFKLWDEKGKTFVSFREVRHLLVLARYAKRTGGLLP